MQKVTLAIIGCGRFANRVHYPALTTFDDVEIAGICDLDEGRLNATGDHWRIASRFADYRRMLEKVRPDGVYVIMPEEGRAQIVREVLQRGHPVFIEKPPARTTGEIRDLAELADANGLITMVGCNRRFIPVLVEARRRMHERGPVVAVSAAYYKNELAATFAGADFPDVLVSDGIHAVDTLRWLAGSEAARVRATARRLFAEFDNDFRALVEFENGCVGLLRVSWAAGNRYHAFELHGRGISAYVEPDSGARIVSDGRQEPEWTMASDGRMDATAAVLNYGFLQENRHFVDCLKSGRATDSPFSDAVKSMELIDLIKAAAQRR
jgi:predicted dehydrogenase